MPKRMLQADCFTMDSFPVAIWGSSFAPSNDPNAYANGYSTKEIGLAAPSLDMFGQKFPNPQPAIMSKPVEFT